MSKGNATESSLLSLIYQAVAWANMADNASSSPFTQIYVSLHTGDPGEAGTELTNECAYGSYARVAVARTAGGWAVAAGVATNVAQVQWPTCTSGSETATHFATGTAASGAGTVLHSGALSASLAISSGIQPQAAASALVITED